MAYVDWEAERNLIQGNLNLDSAQLDYGLKVLEHARTLYPIGSDIPGSIRLCGKDGYVFHVVKTKNADSNSVEVRLPPKFKTVDIIGVSVFIAGAVVLLYLVKGSR